MSRFFAVLLRTGLAPALGLAVSPSLPGATVPVLRVVVEGPATGLVRAGPAELVWTASLKEARIPICSLSAAPLTVFIETAVLPGQETRSGGLRGLTRGFVGVISLGASELNARTAATAHTLQPGEQRVVAQTLSPSAQGAEVVSRISVGAAAGSPEARIEQRDTRLRQLRQERGGYHEARKEEEARWRELRSQLMASQGQCRPLTPEYKEQMDRYWEALGLHRERIKSLETAQPAPPGPPK